METEERRLTLLLRECAGAVRSLAGRLPDAYERQWSPGGGRSPALDYSDPTGETAVDVRRLRVRTAVLAAERRIEEVTAEVAAAEQELAAALAAWTGVTDPDLEKREDA